MSPECTKKWSLLNKLKKAVKKINFLIRSTYNYSQWSLASISILCAASPARRRPYTRHLSFNNEVGIYHGCSSEDSLVNEDTRSSTKRNLSSFRSFGRMKSFGFDHDHSGYGAEDVDRRADLFIENFYRQLRMERQISLELRYCNDDNDASNDSLDNKNDTNYSTI